VESIHSLDHKQLPIVKTGDIARVNSVPAHVNAAAPPRRQTRLKSNSIETSRLGPQRQATHQSERKAVTALAQRVEEGAQTSSALPEVPVEPNDIIASMNPGLETTK
jgi:hypothetical protein